MQGMAPWYVIDTIQIYWAIEWLPRLENMKNPLHDSKSVSRLLMPEKLEHTPYSGL